MLKQCIVSLSADSVFSNPPHPRKLLHNEKITISNFATGFNMRFQKYAETDSDLAFPPLGLRNIAFEEIARHPLR